MERHAEQALQVRAGRAAVESGPHLPEDLPLAGDHRVEPRGDAEQVQRGRLVLELVHHRRQLVSIVTRKPEQRLVGALSRTVLLTAGEVDLGPVAGREHDRLAVQG